MTIERGIEIGITAFGSVDTRGGALFFARTAEVAIDYAVWPSSANRGNSTHEMAF